MNPKPEKLKNKIVLFNENFFFNFQNENNIFQYHKMHKKEQCLFQFCSSSNSIQFQRIKIEET